MAILYEVRVTVEVALALKFEHYMRGHMADVLSTGYFAGASIARVTDSQYLIIYEADSRADIEKYLEKESPRLRADFAAHFPEGVNAQRSINDNP